MAVRSETRVLSLTSIPLMTMLVLISCWSNEMLSAEMLDDRGLSFWSFNCANSDWFTTVCLNSAFSVNSWLNDVSIALKWDSRFRIFYSKIDFCFTAEPWFDIDNLELTVKGDDFKADDLFFADNVVEVVATDVEVGLFIKLVVLELLFAVSL